MKINKIALIAGAALCLAMSAPLAASAATPEEAAALAEEYGYPPEIIQQCWNEYDANPELYPPEVIDEYMEQLREAGRYIVTDVPYDPEATVPPAATTSAASQGETHTTAVGEQGNSNGSANNGNNDSDIADNGNNDDITLTMPDGSTFTRISKAAFIALSYEDKMAYLSTFTPEQQAVFIQNLSPEEYRSLMKQLPADKKLEVVDSLSKATDAMGFKLSVDELTENNLKLSMRNKDGELVAVGQAKEVVEDTGYNRGWLFLIAGAAILVSAGGAIYVAKNSFGKEEREV